MKTIKNTLLALLGTIMLTTLVSCEKDEKEPIIDSFTQTTEYKEFFSATTYLTQDEYYDSEWKCTHVWPFYDCPDWVPVENIFENVSEYVSKTVDSSAIEEVTQNYYEQLIKGTNNLYIPNEMEYIAERLPNGELHQFSFIEFYGRGVRFGENPSSQFALPFVKKDVVITSTSNGSFLKYKRI